MQVGKVIAGRKGTCMSVRSRDDIVCGRLSASAKLMDNNENICYTSTISPSATAATVHVSTAAAASHPFA